MERKNIFVSHVHEDDGDLNDVKNLAREHGVAIADYSVTSDNPNNATNDEYIMRDILKPRIDACSVLAVYITPITKNSEWVEKEIQYANKIGKPIIGIWARGHAGCEPPDELKKTADAMVAWNGKNVVAAIKGEFKGREDPEGNLCEAHPFKRIKCQ